MTIPRPGASADSARLASLGAALAAPARADIVCALLAGTAHTTSELARHVGVAVSTASEHIGVLVDAGLVETVPQGRHRYHRLAGLDVAAAIESLIAVPSTSPAPLPSVPAKLRACRSCYDHLAGRLGVGLRDGLHARGWVVDDALTDEGRRGLTAVGVDLARGATRRPLVRPCLDWSERRHHLAGLVPARVLDHAVAAGWLRRDPAQRRHLRLTPAGAVGFADAYGVAAERPLHQPGRNPPDGRSGTDQDAHHDLPQPR
ncbi:MAG: helix-turn-helix domain-containing protein [Acidimicrobiales bacterium]